jgi:hypothetical protein
LGFFERLLNPRNLVESQWIEDEGQEPILRINLHGSFGSGSDGKVDERNLEKLVTEEVESFKKQYNIEGQVKAILDLHDYAYSWGDDFVYVLDFFDLTRRYAIIVNSKCRRGISTLMKMDINTRFDCVEDDSFVLSNKEALQYLKRI